MADERGWPEELVNRLKEAWQQGIGDHLARPGTTSELGHVHGVSSAAMRAVLNTLASDPEAKRAIMGKPAGYVSKRVLKLQQARLAGPINLHSTGLATDDAIPLYAIEEPSEDEI